MSSRGSLKMEVEGVTAEDRTRDLAAEKGSGLELLAMRTEEGP